VSAKDVDKDRDEAGNDDTESVGTDDTEGHNLFALSDFYVNSKIGRQVDFEREARQNTLAKEARARKKERR